MRLISAIKAFWKVLIEPRKIDLLLEDKTVKKSSADISHLRLLQILQNKGRLLDFLKEDLSPFTDAQVGAVVRKVHDDCAEAIEEIVTLRPVMSELEGTKVAVDKGYDPAAIRIIGNVKGEPPYEGVLRHPGWKAHKVSLPKIVGDFNREIVAPAEVEVR